LSPPSIEFPGEGIGDGEVRLRLLREEDLPALVSALQGPEFGRWTRVPHPYGDADARAWFTKQAEIRRAGTGLHLIVADARDDRLLGSVGLTEIDWEELRAQIGYWVTREHRRRGVATRSVRLLAKWSFEELPLERLGILADRQNAASAGVAERAGFKREGLLRSYTIIKDTRRDMVSYSLLPEELPAQTAAPGAVR
jgi:[ribosomal protein S5]-alanine N-acetyltransferase